MIKNVFVSLLIVLSLGVLIVYLGTKVNTSTGAVLLLEEAGSMDESPNSSWWLNSGGEMFLTTDGGATWQGNLPENNKWRIAYEKANPTDTDNGYHPQNIFRLVSKSIWQNFEVSGYFTINNFNKSDSPNRNQSNALLLFSHYQDSATLYYAGVRVDGYSVIKKKYHGEYSVIDERQLFPEKESYNHDSNPLLLPMNTPIGLRFVTQSNLDGSVKIRLYTDLTNSGIWTLSAEGTDTGKDDHPPITPTGQTGIRTDFMDVSFDRFNIQNTQN